MKVKRLDKLPKRKVTVDELLDLSDMQEFINDVIREKDNIDELVIIYTSDGAINWSYTTSVSRLIYLLEQVKHCKLSKVGEEE